MTPVRSAPTVRVTGTLSQLLGSGVAHRGRTHHATGLFGLAFQTASFQALIQFLESQGSVHVLSSPRIATLNNQKAVLKVGTDDFFVTNVTTSTVTAGADRDQLAVDHAAAVLLRHRARRDAADRRGATTSSCTCTLR